VLSSSLELYLAEVERVWSEILSLALRAEPRVVADVGAGDSTQRLLQSSVELVIALDADCCKLARISRASSAKLELLCADARLIPLRSRSVDLAVLHFVLHEIDPRLHREALAEVGRAAKRVLITEPTPRGSELYAELWRVWRSAARFMGSFEEYRDPSYWLRLLDELGFRVLESRVIRWRAPVPHEVLEDLARAWSREWVEKGVPREVLSRLWRVVGRARFGELRWSSIFAVLALSPEAS